MNTLVTERRLPSLLKDLRCDLNASEGEPCDFCAERMSQGEEVYRIPPSETVRMDRFVCRNCAEKHIRRGI